MSLVCVRVCGDIQLLRRRVFPVAGVLPSSGSCSSFVVGGRHKVMFSSGRSKSLFPLQVCVFKQIAANQSFAGFRMAGRGRGRGRGAKGTSLSLETLGIGRGEVISAPVLQPRAIYPVRHCVK